ncbi:hypothetical protein C2845_PM06G04690 [Panicum miliaceum]|uniref:KIB1-4 beta-propeller domain-containing protein n=1 Tax=Panicum miliaceum TaxID=4540 RepID=A0A3L6RFK9_PANMI|nr:hypothetical protein C2845_PM06G04690 [Panicum miliaceum]
MRSFFKLALPSSRRVSPDSLFAALITCGDRSTISVGQASTAAAPASFRVPLVETLSDAAFFDGKLYAISHSNKLFVLDTDSSDQSRKPRIQSIECVVADSINDSSRPFREGYDYTYWRYLVESGDLTDSCGQWRPVSALGGQALFAGTYSRSLPASECGAQEDCIYFMCDYGSGYYDKDPFHDCGLFHVRNGMITPMLPKTAVVPTPGKTLCKGRPAWFFHTESIMADATKYILEGG